ncbi:MAG: hypothetical protein AMXMBFR22_17770 [Phycisphaerae bacterium]
MKAFFCDSDPAGSATFGRQPSPEYASANPNIDPSASVSGTTCATTTGRRRDAIQSTTLRGKVSCADGQRVIDIISKPVFGLEQLVIQT